MDIEYSKEMRYLSSVDSYYDPDTGLIYRCKKSNRDLKNGESFRELNDKWWNNISQSDLSRLSTQHGLY